MRRRGWIVTELFRPPEASVLSTRAFHFPVATVPLRCREAFHLRVVSRLTPTASAHPAGSRNGSEAGIPSPDRGVGVDRLVCEELADD
jgi:hypothetical protein